MKPDGNRELNYIYIKIPMTDCQPKQNQDVYYKNLAQIE